jgi:hypothetical protein
MRKAVCTRTNPQKVAEILASGGTVQSPLGEKCPACKVLWNDSHMLVIHDSPDEPTPSEKEANQQRRQLSILLLEMAEEFFLRAHQWKKKDDGYFQPPPNYRFRKDPDKNYDRSHAVNSQKQVYNPLYANERQWEGDIACGRKPTP